MGVNRVCVCVCVCDGCETWERHNPLLGKATRKVTVIQTKPKNIKKILILILKNIIKYHHFKIIIIMIKNRNVKRRRNDDETIDGLVRLGGACGQRSER